DCHGAVDRLEPEDVGGGELDRGACRVDGVGAGPDVGHRVCHAHQPRRAGPAKPQCDYVDGVRNLAASWVRLPSPSLASTLRTWVSTVRSDSTSFSAITRLARPSATSSAISRSRAVSS